MAPNAPRFCFYWLIKIWFYVELNIRKCFKILVTLVSYCKLKNNLFLIYLAYKLCDDTCYGNLLEVTVVRVELLCSSRADLTKITRTKNGNRSIFNHLLRVLLILSSSSLEFRQEFHQEAPSRCLWVVF